MKKICNFFNKKYTILVGRWRRAGKLVLLSPLWAEWVVNFCPPNVFKGGGNGGGGAELVIL